MSKKPWKPKPLSPAEQYNDIPQLIFDCWLMQTMWKHSGSLLPLEKWLSMHGVIEYYARFSRIIQYSKRQKKQMEVNHHAEKDKL